MRGVAERLKAPCRKTQHGVQGNTGTVGSNPTASFSHKTKAYDLALSEPRP